MNVLLSRYTWNYTEATKQVNQAVEVSVFVFSQCVIPSHLSWVTEWIPLLMLNQTEAL